MPLKEHQQFDVVSTLDGLDFIQDKDDRVILRDFMNVQADVLLTSDNDILRHKAELAEMGIKVMRPSEWINHFLQGVRGEEDGVQWVERILFMAG